MSYFPHADDLEGQHIPPPQQYDAQGRPYSQYSQQSSSPSQHQLAHQQSQHQLPHQQSQQSFHPGAPPSYPNYSPPQPNPFEHPQYVASDPFATPQHPSLSYQNPAPGSVNMMNDRYVSPNLAPLPQNQASPHPVDYRGVHFDPSRNSPPSVAPGPGGPFGGSTYDLHDVTPGAVSEDLGDIPLLRRRNSPDQGNIPNVPGGYGDDASVASYGGYSALGKEEADEEENNIRYGRIPQRVPRRYKTLKKVELFHGNLVLDASVPPKLLAMCTNRTDREFTHMRYSAATCDPDAFQSEGYTLRQIHYSPPRRTELFIVMTMYNEDDSLFTRSMHGVIKNIAHLCTRERSKTWGKEGWKKVVVCVVSDGRGKINARTLSCLAGLGVYQDGIAKNVVNGKPVTAHIYEYTTQISITPSLKLEGSEKGIMPVQIIFCLKEKNQKKINSHRWFFNAFAPILQPNVCVLLDVGTMPGPTSIYHLWKAFDINSNVGGACGEIVALKGKMGVNLFNPLVAAQNFEYKMSNILDKPLESIFGYITVLPGAFSAYRYIALQNDAKGNGPLQKYFLGETMHGAGADIFTANMYLAEDRILCWELVSKRGCSWLLHYVKSAYAVTDVPDQVPELISQRRRWLNGSFFAAIHSMVKFGYIYRSSHNLLRMLWIHIEMVYQLFNLIFSWFALGNYYIAFTILSQALEDPSFGIETPIHIVNLVLNYFYLGLLVMCYLLALGNRPQGSKWGYTLAMVGFAFITAYMTFSAFFLAFKGIENVAHVEGRPIQVTDIFSNSIFRDIVISILSTLGLYLIASLIHFEPWHMITSFLQYLLMAPSYINVLNVYAFANVHDVSWGTKGDNKISTDLGVVKTGPNKNEVEVNLPTDQKDIDAAYEDAIHILQTKPPKEEKKVDAATKQEDYYRTFRTNVSIIVLLIWTLSNGLLAALITELTGKASSVGAQATVNGYMAFILFSVAGLAFVRFVGSTSYMIIRLFAGE